jgi:hypothetical protein
MDGTTLLRQLRQILSETSDSTWLDTKSSYDYLYDAVCTTSKRVRIPVTTQSITTVASQTPYYLNGDFLDLYLTDDSNKKFIKYYDGASYHWIYQESYDSIILGNQTAVVSIPSSFAIIPAPQIVAYTGTVTSSGALANGECTLTDSGATFTNAFVGDIVHNTTDLSNGIVVSKTSNTALVTALFDGTENDWDFISTGDGYRVHPQQRFYLVLDPPPKTAGHVMTVYYVQKPTPVYSNFRRYNFPDDWSPFIVSYAAWKYKYRDREPQFGDTLYRAWDTGVRMAARTLNAGTERRGFGVNFIKRAQRSRTFK